MTNDAGRQGTRRPAQHVQRRCGPEPGKANIVPVTGECGIAAAQPGNTGGNIPGMTQQLSVKITDELDARLAIDAATIEVGLASPIR
jgi:hypothetical protein